MFLIETVLNSYIFSNRYEKLCYAALVCRKLLKTMSDKTRVDCEL